MPDAITRHPVVNAYMLTFTAFALCVLVQFARKRHSYFLKERYPLVALMQLLASVIFWVVSNLVVQLIPRRLQHLASPDCRLLLADSCFIIRIFVLISFLELLTWRIWKLFWRRHLHKHLSSQRYQILKRDLTSKVSLANRPVSWRFKLAKYAPPLYFSIVFCANLVSPIYVFARGTCAAIEDPRRQHVSSNTIYSLGVFFVIIAWLVRKYSDNFHIAREFKRYGLVVAVGLSVFFLTYAINDRELRRGAILLVGTLIAHAMFVVGGFIPIYEQYRLDRRVTADNFADFGNFDDLLENPAALVSFEKFMRKEFCEESLEFYQVVAEYKRMFSLRSLDEQRNAALAIYASFVDPDAPSQINISSKLLEGIRAHLFAANDDNDEDSATAASVHLEEVFDDAQREMYRLMEDGSFIRFTVRQGRLEKARRSLSEPAQKQPVVPFET